MRFAKILFVLATVGVLCTPVVWSQNLLSNPGFESNLTGWTHELYGVNNAYPTPGTAHGGVNWVGTSCSWAGGLVQREIRQTVTVIAGTQYQLSVWVNTETSPHICSVYLQWYNGTAPGSGTSTTINSFTAETTGWQLLSGTVTPTGTSLTFTVRLQWSCDDWGGGGNIDDCSVIPTCPAPAMTYVRNWSFEDLDNTNTGVYEPREFRSWTWVNGHESNWLEPGMASDGLWLWGWAVNGSVMPEPTTGYRQILDALPGDFTARLDWRGFYVPYEGSSGVHSDARFRWVIRAYTASGCGLGTLLQSWASEEQYGAGFNPPITLTLCGTFPATTRLATIELHAWKAAAPGFHVHTVDAVELDCYGPPFTTVTSPTYRQEIDDDANLVCSGYVYKRSYPVTTQTQVRIMRTSAGPTYTYWNGSGWVSNSNTWVSATIQPGSNGGPWSYTLAAAQIVAGNSYTVSARSYDSQSNTECYMDEIEALAVLPVPMWELYAH